MDPRELELALLDRCLRAVGSSTAPLNKDEADVFRYAAMLLPTDYPQAAKRLWAAHLVFYQAHPGTPASFAELHRAGLVSNPSRLKDMLYKRLREHEHADQLSVSH